MTDLELQLVSTKDLSTELAKRFDGIVIYGIQKNRKNNEISEYYDHYTGDYPTLVGLCYLLIGKLQKEFFHDEKDKQE